MARRNKHRTDTLEHELRRDPPRIASYQLPSAVRFKSNQQAHEYAERVRALRRNALSEPEDRRKAHPEGVTRAALDKRGKVARIALSVSQRSKDSQASAATSQRLQRLRAFGASTSRAVGVGDIPTRSLPRNRALDRVRFQSPKLVWVCVRRKIRKEVMHALKVAGTGKTTRQPRRNMYSDIAC